MKTKMSQSERKEAIIDAAEVLFMQSYEQLTMDKVAEIANISKGAIYLHFKSKDEMCLAIVVRALTLLKKRFTEICESGESGLLKIKFLGESYASFQSEFPVYYQALLKYRYHSNNCGLASGEIEDIIRENNNINNIIREIIKQGKADNSIRKDLNEGYFSLLLWGQFSGIFPGYNCNNDLLREHNDVEARSLYGYLLELINEQLSPRS